jgi:ferric-dicitrate binding protein FerR (iron transport regulator)
MSTRDDDKLGVDEQRAQGLVRSLGVPRADADFRARLKAEFMAGAIAERIPEAAEAPPQAPARIIAFPRPFFARPAFWVSAASAAAALAIVVGIGNRGPDWQVTMAKGDGEVIVGAQHISMHDPKAIAAALARGGRVQLPVGNTLELVAPGEVAVRMTRVTDMTLPASPNRWFARDVQVAVRRGDTFYSTGRAFHGAKMHVSTAQANVLVTGTSLAVLSNEDGTCVCVMEGRVAVADAHPKSPAAAASHMIPAGKRFVFPSDGTESFEDDMLMYSEHALHSLHGTAAKLLGR